MQSNPRNQYDGWGTPPSSPGSPLSERARVLVGIGVLITALLLYLMGSGFPPPVWIEVFRMLAGSAPILPHFPLLLLQSFLLFIAWLGLLLVGLQVIRSRWARRDSVGDRLDDSSSVPDLRSPAIPSRQEEVSQRQTPPWKNPSPRWDTPKEPSPPSWNNEKQYSGKGEDTTTGSDAERGRENTLSYTARRPFQQDHGSSPIEADEAEAVSQLNRNNDTPSAQALGKPHSTSGHLVKELRRQDASRLQEEVAAPSLLTLHEDSSRGNTSVSSFRISAEGSPGLHPEGLRLDGWSLCHPGIRRRDEGSEDYLLVIGGLRTKVTPYVPFGLFILADGTIAPGKEGEVLPEISTSYITAHQFRETLLSALWSADALDSQAVLHLLTEGMQQANALLYQHNQHRQTNDVVTMTAMLVLGTEAYTANVGDNRAYLYRLKRSRQTTDEGLFQITNDHSSVATQLEQGTLSPEELFKLPKTDHVYRALGQQATLNNLDIFPITLSAGDVLVLCSDGLWKMVKEATFQQIVERLTQPPVASPSLLCASLTQAALEAGGYDHASIIVVQAQPPLHGGFAQKK